MIEYKCPVCGNVTLSSSSLLKVRCQSCGCEYSGSVEERYSSRGVFDNGLSGKSRGVAGVLAILLGSLGIHFFYLGKNTAGIICLLLTIFSCGIASTLLWVLGIVQGIMMLTMSEEEFENRYIYTSSTFPF